MDLALITMQQVAVLFVLMFVGFIGVKAKVIKADWKNAFSALLINLVNPLLIINSYLSDYNPDIIVDLAVTFVLAAVFMVIGIIISLLLGQFIKSKNKNIIIFATSFSNAVYMGFPLIEALFGAEGLLFASAFSTVFNIILWTFGYGLVSGSKGIKTAVKKIVTNPSMIAVAVGMIIYFAQVPIPKLIAQPIGNMAAINTPLSMIITGMVIASTNVFVLLKKLGLYYVVVLRMIIIPAICFAIMFIFKLNSTYAVIAFLLEACPTAAITTVFAVQFNHDEEIAAGAVVITTVLSIIFLPLWAYATTFI